MNIIKNIKRNFSVNFDISQIPDYNESDSRKSKGEKSIWQRRYFEHTIIDEEDLNNCYLGGIGNHIDGKVYNAYIMDQEYFKKCFEKFMPLIIAKKNQEEKDELIRQLYVALAREPSAYESDMSESGLEK